MVGFGKSSPGRSTRTRNNRAGRSAKTILRVYWHADPAEHVYVVGHVGENLRDDSDP